jgi:hypothetical protein
VCMLRLLIGCIKLTFSPCFVLFLKLKSLNAFIVVVVVVVVLELISRMNFAAKFCCEIFGGVCFCLSSE